MGGAALAITLFFYGPMRDPALREVVLGRGVAVAPGRLAGYRVEHAEDGARAHITAAPGGAAEGVFLAGPGAEVAARLAFYAEVAGYRAQDLEASGQRLRVYVPEAAEAPPAGPWSLALWQERHGATVIAAAGLIMGRYGAAPAAALRGRHGPVLVREASRLRAVPGAPTTLRRQATPADWALSATREPYARFFSVEEYDLSFRRFDGSRTPEVLRAAFISGDAVTVLPYDPLRDRVLLIEQFRVGPLARGDGQPWLLEAIAGRIDPGETPEEAGRREAVEEAGLALGALLPVAQYYPSPGAKSEFLYSFVALCDLPDDAAGVFGVAGEAEDIRGHLIGFDALMALVASGEANVGPLVLSVLWLERERPRLRAR